MSISVLVVDDNRDIRDLLQLRLELWGYRVCTACDGQQALDVLSQQVPDVVLLDMALPQLDGFEVARRIRAQPTTHNVPIIALTALSMPGSRARCLSAGCSDYLTKPFSSEFLHARIESLVVETQNRTTA